jgi:hypothetical protein
VRLQHAGSRNQPFPKTTKHRQIVYDVAMWNRHDRRMWNLWVFLLLSLTSCHWIAPYDAPASSDSNAFKDGSQDMRPGRHDSSADGPTDADMDVATDVADAAMDADAASDIADAAPDIADAAPDIVDAAPDIVDAAPDIVDAASDIVDAAPDIVDAAPDIVDAAPDIDDASAPPAVVAARYPPNGHTTGSIHVPASAVVVDHPLRPKLMWNAAAGASEYQVQLTSECTLSSFRSCPFSSPVVDTRVTATIFRPQTPLAVSTTVPVGRRYYWRVRACNAGGCSAYSTVRYLDVGRHRKDVNGDGYADLIVGAPSQDNPETREGQAYVYFGSATGPSVTPDVTLDNPLDQASGSFGRSVASAGDVNGDGYADLIVGAYQQDNPEANEGQAYVYFGSATGPSVTPDVTLDNPLDQADW